MNARSLGSLPARMLGRPPAPLPEHWLRRRPQDPTRVGLAQEWERKYWSRSLDTPVEKLTEAVNRVGNSLPRVLEYLQLPRR